MSDKRPKPLPQPSSPSSPASFPSPNSSPTSATTGDFRIDNQPFSNDTVQENLLIQDKTPSNSGPVLNRQVAAAAAAGPVKFNVKLQRKRRLNENVVSFVEEELDDASPPPQDCRRPTMRMPKVARTSNVKDPMSGGANASVGRRPTMRIPKFSRTSNVKDPMSGGANASVGRRRVPASLSSSVGDSDVAKDHLGQSEIIFIGTGSSEGIPRVSCLTDLYKTCHVCSKAAQPGNKNKRLNTSLLVRFHDCNILIDAGKFFYHSALTWFPAYGIRRIDAVIITHAHADAIGGLDDLRDWTNNVQTCVPIYTTMRDFEVMKKTHYYLIETSCGTPAVSNLKFNIIHEEPFRVHDLQFTPLPVWHGSGYRSLGFRFGNICYISDVSDIPEETYPLLENCEILILDALRPERSSSTHFLLPRALEEVRKIQPKRTLFTGMMHLMDHEKISEDLLKLKEAEGLDVQLSYDGLRVPIKLHSGKTPR